jgi:uncharacterized membrane protein
VVGAESSRGDTETRLSPTARVEAFSDGVMAIAITLLVLDLKVPSQADLAPGGLLSALADRWPSYVAYLAAFLTIGIIWLNHSDPRRSDRTVRRAAPLAQPVAAPGRGHAPLPDFARRRVRERDGADASTATVLYGLCATLMALPWGFIWRHLADRPELLEPGYDSAYARAEWRRGSIGVPIYAAATVVALVAPLLSLLLFLSIAVLYAVTSQGVSVPKAAALEGDG